MPGLFGGVGNYFVPIFQGSPEVVYPRVNNFSILILSLSYLFVMFSLISAFFFDKFFGNALLEIEIMVMLVMFGMSLPGGYISSQRNQAKGMLEVKRLAVEFTS